LSNDRRITKEWAEKLYDRYTAQGLQYHTFIEVAAKDAARDCGAKTEGNTRQMCKEVWDRN